MEANPEAAAANQFGKLRVGVVNEETWAFFKEIFAEFESHFLTTLFRYEPVSMPVLEHRVNRFLLRRKLRQLLRLNDVVFFEWASERLAQASHLPKSCGLVTRLHRYEMYQWADKVNWDAVDRIILVSQAKRREFAEKFPRQADKAIVIPEAIDADRFQPSEKPFRGDLGILCHLSPRKRVYELVLVFSRLLESGRDFRLHIGGAGHGRFPDYEPAIRSLVERLGIHDRVTFYGKVEDSAAWYRNIDVFISNSYSEGLQVSPMEAMASGCYCLSHWWDGAEELLPEAQLFRTDDELIGRLLTYADSDPAEKQRQRNFLRQRVLDRFNLNITKQQIRGVVEEVGGQYT